MKKTRAQILIADDNEDILFSMKILLKKHFETIFTCASPGKVIRILSENKIDVVLLDMNYRIGYEDGHEGIHFLKEIKLFSPHTQVILITAFGKVETAVEGIKTGAFDYLLKPWENNHLISVVKSAVSKARKTTVKQGGLNQREGFFKGSAPKSKKAYALADKIAKTNTNVLILGENGTGKFIMAKYVHQQSQRKNRAFVHLDLGALSESLFESALFGYARGAFTDARTETPGLFETAENGTIFLDEIGNLSLNLQSKLLQVIQNKIVIRLGEVKPRKVNVRIITATNVDLKKEVSEGRFRQDLYYRLNTIEITLPALRECKEDIVPLAQFFLVKMIEKYECDTATFSDEALIQIKNFDWRGNIREMENKIERAVLLCEKNCITPADLELEKGVSLESNSTPTSLSGIEKENIVAALGRNSYNISQTAKELEISRAALYRRMEKYNL